MSDRVSKADDRTQYGGQAVVEGVMMRSTRFFAIACRLLSNNEIVVKLEPVSSALPSWLKWLNKPFLRGSAALVDAMAMGIRALTYSANVQLEDEGKASAEAASAKGESTPSPLLKGDSTPGPLLRGESTAAGAANLAMGEGIVLPQRDAAQQPPPAKTADKNGKPSVVAQSINGIAIGATTVVALLFGFALFWIIPAAITDGFSHHAGHGTAAAATVTGAHKAAGQITSSLIEGVIRLAIFFAYLGFVSRMAHVKRVFEYHGAEHKAINTLEANLPLTLENTRTVSRIHPRCGTNFIFIVLMTAILVFSVVPRHGIHDGIWPMLSTHLYRLLLLPIVAGISFEILKFAGSHRDKSWAMTLIAPGLWTQYITTREPDDSQIEVALKSLQAVWDKEHEVDTPSSVAEEPAAEVA